MTDKKIVNLVERKREASGGTVKLFEKLLEMAKRGEIVEAMVISFAESGHFRTDSTSTKSTTQLVGALSFLQHDLIRNCASEAPPEEGEGE